MSEIERIGKSAVGGSIDAHVEVNEPNELGSLEAEAGFDTTGIVSGPPVRRLQETDLGSFLQRLTPIGDYTLATTDVPLSFTGFLDPWRNFVSDTVIARKVFDYKYIRGTLEVEIVVNVPAGCYGLYYLVAIPNGSSHFGFTTSGVGFSPEVVECCPHVKIDLAASTKGKMVLPWINWNDYADIADVSTPDGLDGMYDVRLVCYHPLSQGNGSTTPAGTISMYARCAEDAELVIPFQQGKKEPRLITEGRNSVNGAVKRVTGGLKLSEITGKVAGAASTLAGIPVIGALAAPIAAGASAATSVLDWLGFTRTSDERPPMPVVARPFSNVANADGYDTGEIAALSVANSISIDPRINNPSGVDEAAFDYMMERYVLVGIYPWAVSDVKGTELARVPVNPLFSRLNTGHGAVFPVAGFLSLPFTYWRGDMEYKIVVPVSKMHRGSLQISWAPQLVTTSDVTNNQFNHIFGVSAGQDWQFTVGYASALPAIDLFTTSSEDAVVSTAGANGILRISVVNPLEAPALSADTSVFVFARALPGFDMSVPRTVWRPADVDGVRSTADFATSVILQAGALGDEEPEIVSLTLVPPAGEFPTKEVCFGEKVGSVRMLVQKFSHDIGASRSVIYNATLCLLTNHVPMFPAIDQQLNYWPPAPAAAPAPQWFNWYGWYSSLFLGVAASTRYKIISASENAVPVGVYGGNTLKGANWTAALQNGSSLGQVSPTWLLQQGQGVEVTVPYYFRHKYIPVVGRMDVLQVANGTNEGRVDVLNFPPPLTTPVTYPSLVFYSAAGPDVRFQTLRFPRPVVFDSSGSPGPVFGNAVYTPPGMIALGSVLPDSIEEEDGVTANLVLEESGPS